MKRNLLCVSCLAIALIALSCENQAPEEEVAVSLAGKTAKTPVTISNILEVNQKAANFGIAVTSVGDVNGDGYGDVAVGANFYDNGQTDEGVVYIYHGSATGIKTAYAIRLESNQKDARLGWSVASAGDVNGDGYGDVIVSAYRYDNGQTDEGVVYIYHGSATGIAPAYARRLEVDQANASFGISVAAAGDVNGDGYGDVIVGAFLYDNGQTDEGAAFIYHGSATGVGAQYARRLEMDQAGAWFGYSVASAGDVNGDGYGDVVVGAFLYDNGQTDEGAAFIYHGSANGIGMTADRTIEPDQAGAYFGYSVASAGDVNGDGFDDVVVGAYLYDHGQTDEGAVFIYHGSVNGCGAVYDRMIEPDQAGANFGAAVASAGDVNGDGYDDVIVGARSYDGNKTDEGAAFFYRGSADGLSISANQKFESNQADAFFGRSVASAGDVNGDGYGDVLVGASLYDNGQYDEGAAFFYHGSASGLCVGRCL
ncbi:MAG TPA: integrin alpha [bacterium]|nr:integrin alpha [bacterium]